MGGFRELDVYKSAYQLAMEIYKISKTLPKEEIYSLTDQIRRSSRSICANIAEGYRKRKYPKYFSLKMTDADSECSETTVWLDFAMDCKFISVEKQIELKDGYTKVGIMLGNMSDNPEKFIPKNISIS